MCDVVDVEPSGCNRCANQHVHFSNSEAVNEREDRMLAPFTQERIGDVMVSVSEISAMRVE